MRKYSCSRPTQRPASSEIVARAFDGCGVPSGIITSHMTRNAFLRVLSGKRATGFSMQSELLPSACCVELPSKPHIGQSSSDHLSTSPSLMQVLPRRLGTGVYPSSQRYSNLIFAMLFCVVSVGCLTVEFQQVAGLSHELRRLLSRTHANAFFLDIFQGL